MAKFKVGDKVWVLFNKEECLGMIVEVVPVSFPDDVQVYIVRLKNSTHIDSRIYVSEKSLRFTDFQEAWTARSK